MQVSHVGVNLCFIIDAATYAIAAWCAYSLKVDIPPLAFTAFLYLICSTPRPSLLYRHCILTLQCNVTHPEPGHRRVDGPAKADVAGLQGMLAEGVDAGFASPLPAQQHASGSALKGLVELAAVQPASVGMPAVPDIMQAAEIPVSFCGCTSKQGLRRLHLVIVLGTGRYKVLGVIGICCHEGGSSSMMSCCNALSSWVRASFTVYHDLCRRTALGMRRRRRRGSTSCR